MLCGQAITGPPQPAAGPGGADYAHAGVRFSDYAALPEGYWLLEPAAPRPDSAGVVVFLHGYGGYNPMVYGLWLRHLARKGNIVIYPRYQRNVLFPSPRKFVRNAADGIRAALAQLSTGDHVRPAAGPIVFAGHSYGGTIAANLAVNAAALNLPAPAALFLCAPGTGPFKGGKLDDYRGLPPELLLLIMVNDNDGTVGDALGQRIFETAVRTSRRNLLRQFPDDHGRPPVTAGHNECYSLDTSFDTDIRNFTARRALRLAHTNAVDYHGYWKLLDALIACTRRGEHCTTAFGDTPQQRSLGRWSDGKPVRELEVIR